MSRLQKLEHDFLAGRGDILFIIGEANPKRVKPKEIFLKIAC